MNFVMGTRVYLRTCPHGEPGIVTGIHRGRTLVNWKDLGITGTHRPERIEPAPDVPEPCGSEHMDSTSTASRQIRSLQPSIQQQFWNTGEEA